MVTCVHVYLLLCVLCLLMLPCLYAHQSACLRPAARPTVCPNGRSPRGPRPSAASCKPGYILVLWEPGLAATLKTWIGIFSEYLENSVLLSNYLQQIPPPPSTAAPEKLMLYRDVHPVRNECFIGHEARPSTICRSIQQCYQGGRGYRWPPTDSQLQKLDGYGLKHVCDIYTLA